MTYSNFFPKIFSKIWVDKLGVRLICGVCGTLIYNNKEFRKKWLLYLYSLYTSTPDWNKMLFNKSINHKQFYDFKKMCVCMIMNIPDCFHFVVAFNHRTAAQRTSLWRHNDVIRDEIRVVASHMWNRKKLTFLIFADLSFLHYQYIYCFRV